MANPELRIGKRKISISVAGIVEKDGRLLMVKTAGGYGPPAGHVEGYEFYRPDSALFWELHEETNIFPTFDMSLWGVMLSFEQAKISVGLVYKVHDYRAEEDELRARVTIDEEIIDVGFIEKEQIRNLLNEGGIRKAKWNEPLLKAWLEGKRFFSRTSEH